jgi:hypothetical protein
VSPVPSLRFQEPRRVLARGHDPIR